MSRERELLERALKALNFDMPANRIYEIKDEINAYLASQSEAEPIYRTEIINGEVCFFIGCQRFRIAYDSDEESELEWMKKMLDNALAILHPAPRKEFVRLSEDEVQTLIGRDLSKYELICAVENQLAEKNT